MLMLTAATLLFFPTLASGSFLGQSGISAVARLGISVVVGVFLFGVGMQIGGGCASGNRPSLVQAGSSRAPG